MPDPLAGAAAGSDPLAWVGLALGLVFFASVGGPRVAFLLRATLWAILLYVLLTNADKLAPALERLNRALRFSPTSTAGSGGGRRALVL